MNVRFLQRSFFIQVLALEVLEKNRGLKRKERIGEEKKMKQKTCVIYMRYFAIFKYKTKLRKKMQFFFIIAKVNIGIIDT